MKHSLNLMSERAWKRDQTRCCLRLWSRVFGVVLVSLLVVGVSQWRICNAERVKQDTAEADYEPIRQLKLESVRLQKQIDAIQETEHVALILAKHQPILGLIGLATQAVAVHDQNVYLRQIEIERLLPMGQTTDQPTLTFSLEGISVDSSAVTMMADLLRHGGPFTAVELSTDKISHAGKQAQQAFSIQCTN